MDLTKLFSYGSLVKVEYRNLSVTRSLSPTEMGYDSGGYSFIVSREKFYVKGILKGLFGLDTRVRKCLEEYTYPFFLFGSRFVPHSQLIGFVNAMDKLIRLFNNRKDYLFEHYDAAILEALPSMQAEAKKAFYRHKKLGKETPDIDTFVNNYVEKLRKTYPTIDELKSKMIFNYYPFQVGMADLNHLNLPADQQHINERVQQLRIGFNNLLEQDVHKFVESIVTTARNKFANRIMKIHDGLKKGTRYSKFTELNIKGTLAFFERKDIANDVKMRERSVSFQTRFVNRYQPLDFRDNRYLRNNLIIDLYILASSAKKVEEINDAIVSFKKVLGIL